MAKSGFNFDAKAFDKLLNDVEEQMKQEALESTYDYQCPTCNQSFKVSVGKNICPNCQQEITLTPDDSWN